MRVKARNACGLSAASPEPTLTITGSMAAGEPGARLVSDTSVLTTDSFGNAVVIGEVKGAWGSRPAAFVRANATFYRSAGEVVGTDFTYVYGRARRLQSSGSIDDATLGAGDSGCFYMYTSVRGSQIARATAGASWNTSVTTELNGNVRDSQNHVIDCDFTYVTGSTITLSSGISTDTALLPGQSGAFTNYNKPPRSSVSRVIAWPAWQEAEVNATSLMSLRSRLH